ncbi:DUF1405 domain-containing protein [Paenibacillus sp. KN14-4R]|uniref:DUF1405 domain-containing protein n=1 Tax=Paenibacillus sp. KN14-4R TaxID=3445773 RepID=UPI003F9F3446
MINLIGTVYGYYWYWWQLVDTAATKPLWYLPFVPDSPTASLFYTLSLLYLLFPAASPQAGIWRVVRGFIEAFAIITSVKYGIWAVSMIFASAWLGDTLEWQSWMLIVSHLGMVFEVLLYGVFYRYGIGAVICVAIWTLWNDYMDYHEGIFPGLSRVLLDHLGMIEKFTISLSICSIILAIAYIQIRKRMKV